MRKSESILRQEIAVLKAKLYLDQISLSFNIVAEYPDMVEDNRDMLKQIELKDQQLRNFNEL